MISENDRRRLPIDRQRSDFIDGAWQRPADSVSPLAAPDGAPNIVLILIDDMGFGASSAFGGPIHMPAAERLSGEGLSFTRFHVAAVCSPTRASLLTGRNPHAVEFGTIPEVATDVPGYTCIRPRSAAPIARVLRDNGYSTSAFGKMHQTPPSEVSPVGPFDRWPTGEGFEYFYGIVGPESDQYYPPLYENTTSVRPPASPEDGYHLSEDLVDHALSWIETHRAIQPSRPFFTYLSFGATHAPLQVHDEWRKKYEGRFDEGWNVIREETFRRQQELGIIPADAELPVWLDQLPTWSELNAEQQRAAISLMELYAGFAEHTDQQVGRLLDGLEDLGIADDTLVMYILGDNGASAEGGIHGTVNEWHNLNGFESRFEDVNAAEKILGTAETYPQYAAGWALAMNAPYQWMKTVAGFFGGSRNPLLVRWPQKIKNAGEVRTQWHHVNDVVPTILEAARIPHPESVDGIEQQRMDGVSMCYTWGDAAAEDRHTTQYFEVFGNRGIYHDGWMAVAVHRYPWLPGDLDWGSFDDDRWHLYDTRTDWTQAHDIASSHPEKLEELKALFREEAIRNKVFPMTDKVAVNMNPNVAGRWDIAAGRSSVTYPGTIPPLMDNAVINVRNRSHAVTARVRLDESGSTCVVASHGGIHGGWALYLREGRLAYTHNVAGKDRWTVGSDTVVPVGDHELALRFDFDGGRPGAGGKISLMVDGTAVGDGRIESTTPFSFGMSTQFAIAVPTGLAVSPDYPSGEAGRFRGLVRDVRIDILSDAVEVSEAERRNAAIRSH